VLFVGVKFRYKQFGFLAIKKRRQEPGDRMRRPTKSAGVLFLDPGSVAGMTFFRLGLKRYFEPRMDTNFLTG